MRFKRVIAKKLTVKQGKKKKIKDKKATRSKHIKEIKIKT